MDEGWLYMVATVVDGQWVFTGDESMPRSGPDCGLLELVRSLHDHGWEIDPRSVGGAPIRLRRPRIAGGCIPS